LNFQDLISCHADEAFTFVSPKMKSFNLLLEALLIPFVLVRGYDDVSLRLRKFPSSVNSAATFPSDPSYGYIKYFTDNSCSYFSYIESVLLGTCLPEAGSSQFNVYTCRKSWLYSSVPILIQFFKIQKTEDCSLPRILILLVLFKQQLDWVILKSALQQ
jgi:hypothetical protein